MDPTNRASRKSRQSILAERGISTKRLGLVSVLVLSLSLLASGFAAAADDSKVTDATKQVERGARKIPGGEVGDGVEETAKGIGNAVSEGAEYSAEKLQEAGKAAEPPAKTAWGHAPDGAVAFGHTSRASLRISSRTDSGTASLSLVPNLGLSAAHRESRLACRRWPRARV